MRVLVSNISLGLNDDPQQCFELARKRLGLSYSNISGQYLVKRSVDARRRGNIRFICTVGFEVAEGTALPKDSTVHITKTSAPELNPGSKPLQSRPVIIGLGPAGLFCGLYLARCGYRPVILERGGCIKDRVAAVESFHSGGALSPECNVQFGEGGAGTFSDGKLTTRINDPRCDAILRDLHRAGAPEEILYNAKPHIGTDLLRGVVAAIRAEIELHGGTVHFNSRMDGLFSHNGRVSGVSVLGERLDADVVVLAMGHSARDTFSTLYDMQLPLVVKPFSVGARIEHLQSEIDRSLYGGDAGHPLLPKGEYQLSWRDGGGRAVYTFCMCPGGVVVPAASQQNTVVTNGMSYHSRSGENANSALVVSVDSRDFGTDPMAALSFQTDIEQRAFAATGGYAAPMQTVGDFLQGRSGSLPGRVKPSYSLGVRPVQLESILPSAVTELMRTGLGVMERSLHGFSATDALLTAPETRTSSPLRLLRDEQSLCCKTLAGLYPCGEGCGYAGGIMSAAADGIRVAEKIIAEYKPID